MTTQMTDLNRCRNMFGPLAGEQRMRLNAVLEDPTTETWDDAFSIIIGADGFTTLWQAVNAVDPEYARDVKAPVTRWVEDDSELGGHSEPVSGWSHAPSRETLLRALEFATR